MNAADLARLELAKRAYAAAQPSAAEVQAGVRRARLSLRRGKARRNWFGKGLVLVVLAVGGLAYAKPHALGELVEGLSQASRAGSSKPGGKSGGLPSPPEVRHALAESMPVPAQAEAAPHRAQQEVVPQRAQGEVVARSNGVTAPAHAQKRAGSSSAGSTAAAPATAVVSDWGRVAQALGHGDETAALAALSELASSDDKRTRDKADLGRAQLLLSRGELEQGCALARSLKNRSAGSHIEWQAQLLLESCAR